MHFKNYKKLVSLFLFFLMFLSFLSFKAFGREIADGWEVGSTDGRVVSNTDVESGYSVISSGLSNVKISALGNVGKLGPSTGDEMPLYYYMLNGNDNFELSTTATVNSIVSGNNQIGFGIMVRDNLDKLSNNIASGIVNQKPQVFSSTSPSGAFSSKTVLEERAPLSGDTFNFTISKQGTNYKVSIGRDGGPSTEYIGELSIAGNLYVGLFAARNASITFTNTKLNVQEEVTDLRIVTPPAKITYTTNEDLDTAGLTVAATTGGVETTLTSNQYIVSGFQKGVVGVQTITVSYGGKTATFDVEVQDKVCTALTVKQMPAKTTYNIGDKLDPSGMIVEATYNNSFNEVIDSTKYNMAFNSQAAGEVDVTLTSTETPSVTTSFKVTVTGLIFDHLEVTTMPQKLIYYVGDSNILDTRGMVISAVYSDSSKSRLSASEYSVGELDTTAAGNKIVKITYLLNAATADLNLEVREVGVSGLKVSKYPKTTFNKGDAFSYDGLEVLSVYSNNSTKQALLNTDYTIDSSNFNSAVPGMYAIKIIPVDSLLETIAYNVSVMDAKTYVWNALRFGQSTSASSNFVEYLNGASLGNVNGTIKLTAYNEPKNAGKITGDQDGITYYYTEVDANSENFKITADIKVDVFASDAHSGQESFGIMARDTVNLTQSSAIFSSNIAAVGGFAGLSTGQMGIKSILRDGVTDVNGNEGIKRVEELLGGEIKGSQMIGNTYTLTLGKDNSGYYMSYNGNTKMYYKPDILNVIDTQKIYVGFYTARNAIIEVNNVKFTTTNAATDPPREYEDEKPHSVSLSVTSLTSTSSENYNLTLMSNTNGVATIKQGDTIIASDLKVEKNKQISVPTKVAVGNNSFTITFWPDTTENVDSYEKVIKYFNVTRKSYDIVDLFISPDGKSTNTGTIDSPLDFDTAIDYVKPGQTIYALPGTYVRNSDIYIRPGNNGTESLMKNLRAHNDGEVIIDLNKKGAFLLEGNYWHVYGLTVTNSANSVNAFTIGGHNNIVESCITHHNGNTGMQISRISEVARQDWPSNNLVLNCTSHDNRDLSNNNADGFAAKIFVGEGNVFRGCIAYNNIDDGWDLYAKVGSGSIGAVLIENCIAFKNGTVPGVDGFGDGNGFKLGGEGISVLHTIKNCIAYENITDGFTNNSNPSTRALNNISFNNNRNLGFSAYSNTTSDFAIDGFISYNSPSKDAIDNKYDKQSTFLWDKSISKNENGKQFTQSDFASLNIPVEFKRLNIHDGKTQNIDWNGVWDNYNNYMFKVNADESYFTSTTNGISFVKAPFVKSELPLEYSIDGVNYYPFNKNNLPSLDNLTSNNQYTIYVRTVSGLLREAGVATTVNISTKLGNNTSVVVPNIPVNTTNAAVINDPYVYINGSNTTANTVNTTSTAKTKKDKNIKNAVIYAKDTKAVKLGDKFNFMNDVKAVDNGGNGKDITNKIAVSGRINTAVEGKYILTYKVKGQNGVTVSKNVNVVVAK